MLGTKTPLTSLSGDGCVSLPSMNLTPVFARTQGQEENSLEGQCLKEASLRGSNKALTIGATQGGGSRRGCPSDP